jgi:alpha-tubulin suppressor-like RCC1 family protein
MRGVRRLIAFVGAALPTACAAIVGFSDLERVNPVAAPSEAGVNASLALGPNHACAVLADQSVSCWGENDFGQLGIGTTEQKTTPTPVPGLSKVVFLSVGERHTCAVTLDGKTWCWGSNETGQLGVGPPDSTPHPKPAEVTGASPAKKVQAGGNHSCIETLTKTAECWGGNESGQLGDGTTNSRSNPAAVTGLVGVEKLSAGNGPFTCAVAQAPDAGGRSVLCWGKNDQGQIGQPSSVPASSVPLVVQGITVDPEKVYVGREHACATLADLTITCWGANAHGQLGDGKFDTRGTPALVQDVVGVVDVSPAFDHTCCADNAGKARCWGSNAHGQLGIGPVGTDQPAAQTLDGNGWDQITTDGDTSCGRLQGVNYCWGRNDHGQLGNGATVDGPKPALVKFP